MCRRTISPRWKRRCKTHPVCAVMLEVVQGEGGVEPLDAAYVQAARALTEAHDVLLIVDEVQTGNGRLGTLFGYQQFGILPDIVTTAKGLAGGLPMGACLLGEKVEHTLTPGTHASTFGGNPVCAAAAVAVMNQLTDELLSDVVKKGEYIKAELSACPSVQAHHGLRADAGRADDQGRQGTGASAARPGRGHPDRQGQAAPAAAADHPVGAAANRPSPSSRRLALRQAHENEHD